MCFRLSLCAFAALFLFHVPLFAFSGQNKEEICHVTLFKNRVQSSSYYEDLQKLKTKTMPLPCLLNFTNKSFMVEKVLGGAGGSIIFQTTQGQVLRVPNNREQNNDLKYFALIYEDLKKNHVPVVETKIEDPLDQLEYLVHNFMDIRFTLHDFKKAFREHTIPESEITRSRHNLMDFCASMSPYVFISDFHTQNLVLLKDFNWVAMDFGNSNPNAYITYAGLQYKHYEASKKLKEDIYELLNNYSSHHKIDQEAFVKKLKEQNLYIAATRSPMTDYDKSESGRMYFPPEWEDNCRNAVLFKRIENNYFTSPAIELEKASNLLAKYITNGFIFETPTHSDLFVQMLADLLVEKHNPETQFSLDRKIIWESNGYKDFAKTLKENRSILLNVLHSDHVQKAFERIDSLSKEQDDLLKLMESLFSSSTHEKERKESYIKMFAELKAFLAHEFSIEISEFKIATKQDTKSLLHYRKNDQIHILEFDPEEFNPSLVAPIEEDAPTMRPSQMVERSGAIAGINGGFYGWRDVQRWSYSWISGKVKENLGIDEDRVAVPMAILKTKKGLFNDSQDYIASVGWKEDGSKTAMGLLKVQWFAHFIGTHTKIKLRRTGTDMSPNIPQKYLYIPKQGKFEQIELTGTKVSHIAMVNSASDKLKNGFVLMSESDAPLFSSVQENNELSVDYEWDEKDVYSTDAKGFEGVDNALSGGAILIHNYQALRDFSEINKPNNWRERTAVCLKADGTWAMFVQVEGVSLEDFATTLKNEKCREAVNLDGGYSATMVLSNPKEVFGKTDRVVSDAIVVMPRKLKTLRSFLLKEK
jgi:hypothetical protein